MRNNIEIYGIHCKYDKKINRNRAVIFDQEKEKWIDDYIDEMKRKFK